MPRMVSALVATALCAAFAQDPSRPAQTPTFRSSVDLIAVDVQVLDRTGQPISPFGPERFEVSINGQRRKVVSADFVQATAAGDEAAIARPGVGPVATNAAVPSGPGRVMLLAIDVGSFDAGAWQRVKPTARAFVGRLGPDDRVGLHAYPFGPALRPTTEHGAVRRGLDTIVGRGEPFRTQFNLKPSEVVDIMAESVRLMTGATASRRARGDLSSDAPTVQRVHDRECPGDPDCAARILLDADSAAADLEAQASQSLSGLRAMLGALGEIPGRKTVVLLSAGMPVSDRPGGRPAADDVATSLGRDLAQANAAIYTLHIDASLREAYSASSRRIQSAEMGETREASMLGRWLEQFSDASGGALVRARTDAGDAGLERVLRETSAYYLLGVEPVTADRDGRLRELKVAVREPGVTVRHRTWVIVPKR